MRPKWYLVMLFTLLFSGYANAQSVSITSSAASNSISEGTSVTFTATPTGYTTPAYQWYKNEIAISGETGSTYTTTTLTHNDLIYVTVKDLNPPSGGSITTNGLIVQLDASDPTSYTSGNTWTDLKGNANGAINGAVSYNSNSTASYFSFPGANSAYIKSSVSQAIKDFTIIFQPDFSHNNYNGGHTLFAKGTNDDYSLRFWSYNFSGLPNPNAAVWGVPHQNSNGLYDWAGTNSFFLNGVNQTSNFPALVYGWNILGGTNNTTASWGNFAYYLGAPSSSTAGDRPFKGKIAVVLFYNRTLSSAEQIQNYDALKSRFAFASNAIITNVALNNTITLTSAAGTNSQTKCRNTAINNITYSTSRATGATFSGLPTGVTGVWSNNVVTISGTPTVAGNYTYTVALTGGTGTVSASGTITVNPTNTIALSSATGTDAQTLCSTATLTNIIYNTTGATGASFSGLPAGVSGSWSNNVVTISGTPTTAGNYTYTVTLTGGCGTITATGSIVATSMTVNISSSAAGNTICNGDLVTFTATVQNACVTPFFQWYKNGTAIFGATSSTYSSTTLSNSDHITVSCTNTPSIVNDNSLALWLDAGNTSSYSSGITWRDLSGNNRHATLNNGASFDASTGSIVTNGIDQYISVPLFNSGSTNMTMQTWVYINANSHGGFMANGDAAYSIGIGSNVSGEMNSNGDQAWMLFSNVRYINTNTTYPTGWHLVTMTMDNNSKPSYYLDGSFVYTSPSGSNPNSPSGSFYLGAVPGDGSKFYNGKFAAAYFYNRELTANEIEQNYTASAGRFGLSGSTNVSSNTITTTVTAINTLALTSAAGTNSQTVCENSTLTNIAYATTGATGATFSTLPAGLTGTWSNNVVTISGTPTVAGTYTYTINLTGGCGTISTTGSITVTPTNTITLSSTVGTNAQSVCAKTPLTNITYSTIGATGATFSGLPTGVTGAWANNVVTLSGTPTIAGNYTYTVTLTGGCGTVTATGSIAVTTMSVTITSSAGGSPICYGDLVTFTAVVQNACVSPTYQWYKNGTAISGANSATYSSTSISNNDVIYVTATPGSNTGGISTASLIANFDAANYNSSSSRWNDLSTSANHMDFYSSRSYSTAKTATYSTDGGGSLVLNNSNLIYGRTINNTGISGNGGKSMSIWVKFDNDYKDWESIAGIGEYDNPKMFEIYSYNDGSGIYFYNHNSGIQTESSSKLPYNTWYNLTITSNGTSNKVYINGVENASRDYALNTTNSPLYLGAPSNWTWNLGGKIATLNLYNTSLTSQTILDNYNATKDRFTATSVSSNSITTTVTANNTVALSSVAGTNSQTVCINSAINSISYSTTGATGVTFSGLPAGVSGAWSTNMATISGTPTVAGTYTYTVNLTGGCGTISATGSIVVNPDNTIALSSAAGTDMQTLCKNTALTNITYATTGATGASFSGLPAGVSGAWSSNVVTLSGTPSFVGTYTYTVTLTGGCSTISTTGIITVNSSSISITSSAAGQNICKGDLVTFTSSVLNGGTNLSYQWYANGNAIIGANSDSYSSTTISNGDQIYVNFASSCTVGQSGSITTSGLKFNYDAGNSSSYISGTTWNDVSGNNTNATFQSTPIFISSPIKTFQWNTRGNDRSNSTKATLNNVLGDDMTVGAWIKTTNVGNSTAHYRLLYILTSEAGGGANDWGFGIDNSGKLAFGAGPNDVTYATNAAVNTGNWTYVAATREKATGLIKLYINGAFDKSGTGNSGNTLNAQSTIVIADGNDGPAYTFEGNIAIVEGYNKVLTVNEILSNYNANASKFGYLGGTSINSNTLTTTVTSITLSSAAGSDAKSTCVNTAMGNITYATTGVTAASVSGLPAGLTGNWANDVYTISGTPTETGTINYTVTLIGGCNGNITASGTITVNPTNEIALTSIAASTSQTLCINTALSSITYSSTSATGATYSGLPAGVNGSYSNGVVTISGTPTASGTFNYTVLLTGGCGNVTATGTIIVTPNNTITLSSAAGTDNAQTPCLNNPITTITYTTARATDATVSGLPAGVTGVWSNNVFTISGTPTESGTFNYTITLLGGCGVITKTGTITVKPNNTIALTSASATSAQTLCFNNTAITTINYSTTTATGATYSGFPAGINTSWSGNVVTISGTPTASGTYTYTVTTSGGCVNTSLSGTIIVKALPVIELSIVGDGCSDKTNLIATTGLTSYAWYKDNVVVNGAAGGTFTPSAAGVYKVQVSDGACSNTSTTTTISTCGLTAEGKTMPTATSTTLVSIEGTTNNGTGVNVAGKILDITVTNSINIIETPTNGGSLVLNLDARNLNSLSHTANPGTWYDLSGNDNDATVYGDLAFGTGNGGAMNFPGGNANYAQAKNGVYFNGSSFTIQSWVYPIALNNWNRIIDFGNGAGQNNILLSNTYGMSGAPGLYIEGGQFQANTVLTLNAWHFVCATFDLTTRIATIYVDGQPSGTRTMSPPVNVTRTKCYIGKSNWGNPPDPNFNGGIGSVQIYNGYLTADEILSNYNSTKSLYGIQ